ncbi:hypothetical protein JNUCC1_01578 [Lentibacillus sp. JNUCC-1]|uniref:hypothetical protein n=1 Tax=Lentibacillus sp. JNUCC-1 TaxID=2654513 RepID=UPI0012E97B58|nr:hypothetical protein [Lentibacillus sp. JNUCC-1]MUV37772.1 hypothetical protein [Lentibacillus sp. JNUCC-1]
MKKYLGFPILLLVALFLSACSAEPSVELVDADVQIVKDKALLGSISITEGEREGEALIPTALYYEFTIENAGSATLGTADAYKGLNFRIEPKEELQSTSEALIGFNVFNPEEYEESGVGYGSTTSSILESGEEAENALYYDLGVSEKILPCHFWCLQERLWMSLKIMH